MANLETGRHRLPLLAVSQAQKEITHNEALVIIDALLHPAVEGVLAEAPVVTDADIGKCWLIGSVATGIWATHESDIAVYVGGGWRYIAPADGMRIWDRSSDRHLSHVSGQWVNGPSITNPSAGAVVDVEARATLTAILQYFRLIGLLTP